MIKKFIKSLLLIDILKALTFGIKVALFKKPVTIKLPKQEVPRPCYTRKYFLLDHSKCIQCKICESVCPCKAIVIINDKEHRFESLRCAYCGLCEKACPKGAIKFNYKGEKIKCL